MREMDRREFIKQVAIGGAVLGLRNAVFHQPLEALASGKYDIGQCNSVRIKCISEVGWHDPRKFLRQIRRVGGSGISQWVIPWDPDNSALPSLFARTTKPRYISPKKGEIVL